MIEGGAADPDIADFVDPESPTGQALAAMKRVDRDFSVADSPTAPAPPTR